jgi:osmotically-inducible protein OsmY
MLFIKKYLFLTLLLSLISGCTEIIHNITDQPVKPEPTSTPIGTGINDWNIETMVGVNIKKADPRLESAHINVYAYNAVVLLTGEADTQQLRALAGDTARNFHGVRQVYNEIQILPPSRLTSRSHDSWLATKVRTKLIAEKNFDSSPIQVACENDIIYLLGLVSRTQGTKAATVASTTSGIKRVVKVFEYID